MFTLGDWLVSLERSRAALNKTGRERLAQLAFEARIERGARKKTPPRQQDTSASPDARCCQPAAL